MAAADDHDTRVAIVTHLHCLPARACHAAADRAPAPDFDRLSWHDNRVYGIYLFSEKWECHLVLDIDHIVEWICGGTTAPDLGGLSRAFWEST